MIMKSLYQLSGLCVFLVDLVVCQYQWACTEPNGNRQWYIPSERDRDVDTATTDGNSLHIYRVPNLDADCYGPVTAIEYCYRYRLSDGNGPFRFNWTVLILEDTGNNFVINSTYVIESRRSAGSASCTNSGGQFTCCDVTDIESFDLPMNFIFGVTESAQGNTHEATLLGFSDALSQYRVNSVLLVKAGLTLSVGSPIRNSPPVPRGLRMLWFVIGGISSTESPTSTTDLPTSTSGANDSTTTESTLPTDTTDLPTTTTESTLPPSTSTTNSPLSTANGMTSNPEQEPQVSSIIAPAVGGAVGGLIVVIVVVVVVVVTLLFIKKGQQGSMKVDDKKVSLQAYNNALYDAANTNGDTSDTKISLHVPNESANFSNISYEYISEQAQREELGHEYSLPSEINKGVRQAKPPTQEDPHNTGPVYAAAYETPSAYETALSQTTLRTTATYNEDVYMVPATNEHALYSQLSQIKINSFTRNSVKLTELLGAGQFGKVHKGEWTAPGSKDKVDVAVKILKEGAGEQDKVKFLQEAAIMGQFSHPNVVKLYGVITEGEPVMLLIELLPEGDLRELLCSMQSGPGSEVKIGADLPHTLLSYCRQVASGMSYLAGKLFIHRDLAARNILVSEDGACKIADFGMSHDLADTNYYVSHGGMIPVKWTAPEAIHYKKYSTTSDVWSFGCVMYEIWSLGHKPFQKYTNQDCIRLIDKGIRLPPPTGCPRIIYKLMIDCWHPESSSRPDFVSVVQQLSLPDTKLLRWSEEDKATDPEAAILGAGLDKAVDLYKDLQRRYVTN